MITYSKRSKEKYYQQKVLYPVKVFLKNVGEIKTFQDKQKNRIGC